MLETDSEQNEWKTKEKCQTEHCEIYNVNNRWKVEKKRCEVIDRKMNSTMLREKEFL